MGAWVSFFFGSGASSVRSQNWPDALMYLEATSDAVLALSLIAIPAVLIILLLRSRRSARSRALEDAEGGSRGRSGTKPWALSGLIILVSTAMIVSGLEHAASLVALWLPVDGLEGLLKAIAALLIMAAAIALWRRFPGIRAESHDRLQAEISAHLLTQEELKEVRAELQGRIERQRRELVEIQHRFEIALRNSPITVLTQDADMRFTWVHNPPQGLPAEAFLGKTDSDVFPPETAAEIAAAKQRAMTSRTTQELETSCEIGGRPCALYLLIEALRDPDGRPSGTITVAVDITQRKAQEMQLRLLLRELTHRSKNLLAVINAIARQTAARTVSIDDFLENFNARLIAIGCAHDLLVADDWKGASLRTLIEAELSTHASPGDDRIEIKGQDIVLKPDAVQNMALALHELLINAQKYGALSNASGRVQVAWKRPNGTGLQIIWQESGGPMVPPPDHSGFGRMMIENVVGRALDGQVHLSFKPKGVRCEITIPPNQLSPD